VSWKQDGIINELAAVQLPPELEEILCGPLSNTKEGLEVEELF